MEGPGSATVMSNMKSKMLSAAEVSAFCEQIALILNGGIPIYEGTYILYQEMENPALKALLKDIDAYVKDNIPLYEALEKTNVFPSYMVHMVKIGETTGKLEEVMSALAHYYDREDTIKTSIRNVVFYPIMLFAMMGVILIILVAKILPMFQNVFDELDTDVAASSGNMMAASMWIGKIVAAVVLVVFVLVIALVLWYRTKGGRRILTNMGNRLPFTRKVMYRLGIGKFVSAMSLMITSGLDSNESLDLVEGIIDHPSIKKKVVACKEQVAQNVAMEEAIKDSTLITGMNGRMVSVGAKTGVLDVVFQKLSNRYDAEIDQSLGNISTVVETILVVSLSVIVGLVLISVMLPLISIISAIG